MQIHPSLLHYICNVDLGLKDLSDNTLQYPNLFNEITVPIVFPADKIMQYTYSYD